MSKYRMFATLLAIGGLAMTVLSGWTWDSSGDVGRMVDPPIMTGQRDYSKAERAKSALLYINHLNHVVAKLNNMDDLLILQQEYENLTDDNLNLESIQDETTVQLIVQLLDQLHNLQGDSVKSIQAQLTFEQEKRGAIWKALPQPSVLLVANNPCTLAIAVGGAALTSVQNYYNALAEADKKLIGEKFKIAKDKLAYINEINKELFLAQWRLMRDYGISDHERVTREDSKLFLGFAGVLNGCRDDDSNWRQHGLVFDIFSGHEKEMKNLPFYWITRAAAAKAIGNREDLKRSCVNYFELYKGAPIVRKDMDACAMALLYVAASMDGVKTLSDETKESVRKWLRFVEETVRIPEWQTKFAVAMIYRKLGDVGDAKRILKMTLSEVYACIRVWERSHKTNNIFRKTPALEKAYGALASDSKDGRTKAELNGWPNWREETERMVPYEGYVWTAGALYELGDKKVFADMPCDESRCGASKGYIIGRKLSIVPDVKIDGNSIVVKSNGLWDSESSKVELFVDGDSPSARAEGQKGNAVIRFKFNSAQGAQKAVLSVTTEFGIAVRFEYQLDDLSKPPVINCAFPWTI